MNQIPDTRREMGFYFHRGPHKSILSLIQIPLLTLILLPL